MIPGTERLLPVLTGLFQEILRPRSILLRNDIEARTIEKLPREVKVLTGEIPERVIIREGDIHYRVDLLGGQKTGAYLDQQENRKRLVALTRPGGRVLDCFSYTGVFALHQAREAGEVIAVDDSARAVEEGRENARLNGFDRIRFIKDNIFDFLRETEKQPEGFDLIILDPPPFARKKSEVAGGQRGYLELNRRALGCLTPGGILATYSCSHNFSEPLFLDMIREAGRKAGRKVFLLEKSLQSPGSSDFVVLPGKLLFEGTGFKGGIGKSWARSAERRAFSKGNKPKTFGEQLVIQPGKPCSWELEKDRAVIRAAPDCPRRPPTPNAETAFQRYLGSSGSSAD